MIVKFACLAIQIICLIVVIVCRIYISSLNSGKRYYVYKTKGGYKIVTNKISYTDRISGVDLIDYFDTKKEAKAYVKDMEKLGVRK